MAAWFALVAAAARIEGARPGWIAGRSLASAAAALVVGAAAGGLDAEWVVVLLLAVVAWTALAPAPAMPGTARA